MAHLWKAREFWELLKAAVNAWFADRAQKLGASLSFYTILALPPLFVIVLFIVSLWVSAASAQQEIYGQLSALLGDAGAKAVENILTNPQQQTRGVIASAIAIGTLIITATGVFLDLQDSLNLIWGVEEKPGQGLRSFIRNRLLSFAMIVGIGFLLLVSLLLSAGLETMDKYFIGLLPGTIEIWRAINSVVSFGVITLLFALIYKVLPDVKIAWRDVWIGAAITALLFTLGKFLIGMYLGRSSVVSAYGAAGSAIIVLLWVYYSAQILFFGAELTQVYACRFGKRIEPTHNAHWINPAKCPQNEGLSPA